MNDVMCLLIGVAIGAGLTFVWTVSNTIPLWGLEDCAAEHNVYECEFVATPVVPDVQRGRNQ